VTEDTRSLLTAQLHLILQRALLEIRNLALTQAVEQIHDLADTVEFIPALLFSWDDEQANRVRVALARYEAKYPDSTARYTAILDLTAGELDALYRPQPEDWETSLLPDGVR
jgi:hypothetical protein